jgi:hypothetical protein
LCPFCLFIFVQFKLLIGLILLNWKRLLYFVDIFLGKISWRLARFGTQLILIVKGSRLGGTCQRRYDHKYSCLSSALYSGLISYLISEPVLAVQERQPYITRADEIYSAHVKSLIQDIDHMSEVFLLYMPGLIVNSRLWISFFCRALFVLVGIFICNDEMKQELHC